MRVCLPLFGSLGLLAISCDRTVYDDGNTTAVVSRIRKFSEDFGSLVNNRLCTEPELESLQDCESVFGLLIEKKLEMGDKKSPWFQHDMWETPYVFENKNEGGVRKIIFGSCGQNRVWDNKTKDDLWVEISILDNKAKITGNVFDRKKNLNDPIRY